MKKITYYDVLEVSPSATTEEIKLAYRTKVKQEHPDIHNNSDQANKRMILINKAYQVLVDPQSRAAYKIRVDNVFRNDKTKTYQKNQHSNNENCHYQSSTSSQQQQKTTKQTKASTYPCCVVCGKKLDAKWKTHCLYHYIEMKKRNGSYRTQRRSTVQSKSTSCDIPKDNISSTSPIQSLIWIGILIYLLYLILS